MWAPLKLKNILFQNGFIETQNLEHIYGATKTQKNKWGTIFWR
jgi:hypothetical protein